MRRVVLVVLVLLSFSLSAWAGQGTRTTRHSSAAGRTGIGALLSGRSILLSRKLKDLNRSWRRFTASGENQASVYTAIYGVPSSVYYTRGETVSAQGETYLIAYAPELKVGSIQLMLMGRSEGPPPPVTGETPVRLALLNLRTVGSLTDVQPFSLQAEIASFNQALSSLQTAMAGRGQVASGDEEETAADPSLSNLKSIALAAEMYMADYDAAPPTANPEEFRAVLDEYVANADMFKDPESGEYYGANASLSGKALSAITDPSNTVLVYQTKPGKDGRRGVGFVDGHVKKVTEEEWQKLKTASGIT